MTDWKAIVDQHGRLVWATAWRLVGNEADAADCFQDTFVEAVKIDRRETVRDWPSLLRHLATARALDLLRSRLRQRDRTDARADPIHLISPAASPCSEAEAAELSERLRAALAVLPRQQAEVFCLSCLDGLSYQEIGKRLRLTTSAVGVLLHRARRRLKGLLGDGDAVMQTKAKG